MDDLRQQLTTLCSEYQVAVHRPHATFMDLINDIIPLLDTYTRQARIDENKKWQVLAELLVSKDGNYRAVNYLNQRFQELEALNQKESHE